MKIDIFPKHIKIELNRIINLLIVKGEWHTIVNAVSLLAIGKIKEVK